MLWQPPRHRPLSSRRAYARFDASDSFAMMEARNVQGHVTCPDWAYRPTRSLPISFLGTTYHAGWVVHCPWDVGAYLALRWRG